MEYNTSAKGPNEALKSRLEASAQQANELLTSHDVSSMSEEELARLLREYVRLRYLLDASDMAQSDHFKYLGEVSLARGLGVSVDTVKKTELDSKCEGTSSTMAKKILLIIALSKALCVKTDPERNADIATVGELACYVYELLQQEGHEEGCAGGGRCEEGRTGAVEAGATASGAGASEANGNARKAGATAIDGSARTNGRAAGRGTRYE